MKKIILILSITFACFSSTFADSTKEIVVPENIDYYEYCYNSWACVVPDYLVDIITQNILAIMSWKEPLY
jgi:hypothetical protein